MKNYSTNSNKIEKVENELEKIKEEKMSILEKCIEKDFDLDTD
jgi:hypothetical protein